MKRTIGIVLLLICLILLPGCGRGKEEAAHDPAGKRYTYEKDGFGGAFSINIQDDGQFSFSEGSLSSHFGYGKWTLDGNILCLHEIKTKWNAEEKKVEEYTVPFYFKVEEDALVFVEKGSEKFMYVQVKDGERFLKNKSTVTDMPNAGQ